jgi:hypothetical protein
LTLPTTLPYRVCAAAGGERARKNTARIPIRYPAGRDRALGSFIATLL